MSRWILLCVVAAVTAAHAAPRGGRVVAELVELDLRSGTLDARRVRAAVTRQLGAMTACAKQDTWTTYAALLEIKNDKLAVLNKAQEPLLTRDPVSKKWGSGGPAGLAQCITSALGAATFAAGTGSGDVSVSVSVHPVLATSPKVVVTGLTATGVDTARARAAIGKRSDALSRCYAPKFWLSPVLAGDLTIEATLDRRGGVTAAQTSTRWKSFAACLIDVTRATRFPAPRRPPATVTVELELVPGA
jgi:hypothetical protein